MMEGVLAVAELRVRDIMIPRAQMVVVARDDALDEVLRIAIESGHSRFPVIGEDRGEVVACCCEGSPALLAASALRTSTCARSCVQPCSSPRASG